VINTIIIIIITITTTTHIPYWLAKGFFKSETCGFIIQTYIRKVLIKSGVFKRQYILFIQYNEQLGSGPAFYSWPEFFFQQRSYPTATADAIRHYPASWLGMSGALLRPFKCLHDVVFIASQAVPGIYGSSESFVFIKSRHWRLC